MQARGGEALRLFLHAHIRTSKPDAGRNQKGDSSFSSLPVYTHLFLDVLGKARDNDAN